MFEGVLRCQPLDDCISLHQFSEVNKPPPPPESRDQAFLQLHLFANSSSFLAPLCCGQTSWGWSFRSLQSFMILVPSLVPTLGLAYASEHHPGVLLPSLSRSGPGVPLPVLFPITRAIQLHFLWQVRRAIMINIINYRCTCIWVKTHDSSPYPNNTNPCVPTCTVYILQHIQADLVMLSFLHPPNMHLLPLYFSHSLLFFIFTFKLFFLFYVHL